jgi:hypothetical protein
MFFDIHDVVSVINCFHYTKIWRNFQQQKNGREKAIKSSILQNFRTEFMVESMLWSFKTLKMQR